MNIDDLELRKHNNLSPEITQKLIEQMLNIPIHDKMAALIAKLYLLQMIYTPSKNYYSVLSLNKLEQLLLRYGKPVEFIVIVTAMLCSEEEENNLVSFVFELCDKIQIQN